MELHHVFIIHLMKQNLILKCCLMLISLITLIWHNVFQFLGKLMFKLQITFID